MSQKSNLKQALDPQKIPMEEYMEKIVGKTTEKYDKIVKDIDELTEDLLDTIQKHAALPEVPLCPACGGELKKKKFVDSWNPENKPVTASIDGTDHIILVSTPADVSEDFYCESCKTRWVAETNATPEKD